MTSIVQWLARAARDTRYSDAARDAARLLLREHLALPERSWWAMHTERTDATPDVLAEVRPSYTPARPADDDPENRGEPTAPDSPAG